MFDRKNESSEIADLMERSLVKNAVDEKTVGLTKVAEAMDLINRAAEIFDEVGLDKQAEVATFLLESLAKRKKKVNKSKSKKKPVSKSNKSTADAATKGLSSDKMVSNLAHKGWMFNADDTNYADDINDMKPFFSRFDDPTGGPEYWKAQAKKCIDRGELAAAQNCLEKAYKEDAISKYDEELEVDDNWVKEPEWERDEREQDLARMMHELEEEDEDRRMEDFSDVFDRSFRY